MSPEKKFGANQGSEIPWPEKHGLLFSFGVLCIVTGSASLIIDPLCGDSSRVLWDVGFVLLGAGMCGLALKTKKK